MSLTLNQSTSIRPLGEEHLRMFRRSVGPAYEGASRLALSKREDDTEMQRVDRLFDMLKYYIGREDLSRYPVYSQTELAILGVVLGKDADLSNLNLNLQADKTSAEWLVWSLLSRHIGLSEARKILEGSGGSEAIYIGITAYILGDNKRLMKSYERNLTFTKTEKDIDYVGCGFHEYLLGKHSEALDRASRIRKVLDNITKIRNTSEADYVAIGCLFLTVLAGVDLKALVNKKGAYNKK